MNNTVNELSCNLSQLKQNNSILQEQLLESSKVNENLVSQIENLREQSIANEEKQFIESQMKILGDEE